MAAARRWSGTPRSETSWAALARRRCASRAPEEEQAAAAAAATGFVAGGIAAAGLQPESAHYARCRLGSSARTRRSYECVRSIIRAFRADGAVLSDEDFTTVHTDSRRSDWYVYSYGDGAAAGRPQGHFDFECTTLNYVLPAGRSWPQLSWTGATIQSDEDHKGFEKWWIEVAFLAFGKIRTEEPRKRSHHAPVNVTPFVVSAGGGIMEVTDALLPSAKGRSGRHYERQHLSGILLKYRHRLAAEFVSRCCARAGVAFDRHGMA